MLPEEIGLRRELGRRAFRSPDDVWPAVRREILAGRTRRQAASLWTSAALAVVLVIVLLVLRHGGSERGAPRIPGEDFAVTNVRSQGRPAAPIVLRPDPRTLMVVVD